VHVAEGLIIYKSYNSSRIDRNGISSLPYVKIVACQKIWRGRRDASMTGGGGAPRKRLAVTCKNMTGGGGEYVAPAPGTTWYRQA
jgi:hypothetical protein